MTVQRLAVTDSTAARMIGITKAQFLDLVRDGIMPQPRPSAPGIMGCRVADLDKALRPPQHDPDEFDP